MKGKILRNVIIVLVILVIAILVYGVFFSGGLEYRTGLSDVFSSFDVEEGSDQTGSVSGSNVLTILRSVENINLNGNVFSNQSFASLVDKSIELPDAGILGREDIFAPINSTIDITPGETVIINFGDEIPEDTVGNTEGTIEN